MQDGALDALIEDAVDIPTIPATLLALRLVCADEMSNSEDIANVIEQDPSVAAKILRLVNSSFYALANRVTAIPIACTIVGRRVIQNVVLQATVIDKFETVKGTTVFDVAHLWAHSFRTALAMQHLVQRSPLHAELTRDEAYTCGLMHDVGKMLLCQHLPDAFDRVVRRSEADGVALAQAEFDEFGFSHAEVGGMLAREWNLSEELTAAIHYHHDPGIDSAHRRLGLFVHVASSLAHEHTADQPKWTPTVASDAHVALLGLAPADLEEIGQAIAGTDLNW